MKNKKIYQFYYLLASLDLVTIFLTLGIAYSIHQTYESSFKANDEWMSRINLYAETTKLMVEANGPGNDVFKTRQFFEERQKFNSISKKIESNLIEIERDLETNLSTEFQLQRNLKNIKENLNRGKRNTYAIFTELEKNDVQRATSYMADMDSNFHAALENIFEIKTTLRKMQRKALEEDHGKASKLFQREVYVGVAVLGIIGLVLLYGRKLRLQMEGSENMILTQTEELESYKDGLNVHCLVTKTDAKGKITFANDKFCQVAGYDREEVLGKDHRIVNSGYHSKEFFQEMWDEIKRGNTWKGLIKNKAKDGTYYWVDTTISPILDKNGQIKEFISIRSELTDLINLQKMSEVVQEIAHIGGWELDVETFDVKWTDETYRINEMEPGTKVAAEDRINFYAEHEQPRITQMINDCIQKKIPFDSEFEFITAKGNKRWVHAKGVPEIDQNGRVHRLTGTFQDITQQKKYQEEIAQRDQRLRTIFEQSSDAVMTIEPPNWFFTSCNPATLKLFKVESEREYIKLGPWSISPELQPCGTPSADKAKEMIGAAMTHGSKRFNWTHMTIDGEEIPCRILLSRITEGEKVYLQAVIRDISEQKELEDSLVKSNLELKSSIEELQNTKQQLSLLYENSPFGFAFCDMDGNLLDVNEKYEEITGYSLEELKSLSYWDITPKKYEADEAKQIESLTNTGSYGPYRKEYKTKDGNLIPVELNGFIVKNYNGMDGIWSIVEDITEKLSQEKELSQQKQLASHNAKLASIGELAAGVGHEINNPLAIVKGYVTTIQKKMAKDGFKPSDVEKYISKILVATERIAKIVQGLRTFSRSDSTEVSNFSPIDAVKESFNMVQEIYKQDGIHVELTESFDSDCVVNGNRGKFQQILMNLISNARDATTNNNDRHITMNIIQKKSNLILEVKDNGCGIPDEIKEKIFDPFFTTKDVNKGTGIGLSLVHNFIEEMTGKLEVDSVQGEGTTFRIILPVTYLDSKQPIPIDNVESETKKFSIDNIRALIVDDEEDIRELLQDALEDLGIQCVTANNGQEAFDTFMKTPEDFDLIVCDMKIPKMDGPTLLKQIRATEDITQPRFVFVTGGINVNFEEKENELNSLIDGYFYRPFESETILKVIEQIFNEQLKKSA